MPAHEIAEQLALRTAGLVATVGTLTVAPGAANVIPGQAVHTLDVRHARDPVRQAALRRLGRLAAQIAKRRGLKVSWQRTQDNGATPCSPELTASLAQSVKAVQGRSLALVSGPFSRLSGEWRFTPLGDDGCKVEFELNYAFDGLIGTLIAPVFDRIAATFVDAFVKRADALDEAKRP